MKHLHNRTFWGLLLAVLFALSFPAALAEEWVLADDENIVVKVQGFGEDDFWGHTMKLYLENKTDKLLMYSIENCAINGVMNDPFWATEVMAGSKSNEEAGWMTLDGNAAAEGITKISFDFKVYDSEDWMADPLLKQNYVLYPIGEAAVVLDQYEPQASDIVLFDNDEVSMRITGFRNDEIWGYTADAHVQNKTEKTLMFSVENATVNGFMCDPFWAEEVAPNASSYASISWMQDEFETNGINEVEEIKLAVRVYDYDDWMADALVEQQFTVNP